jgi:hypothetical protein
MYNFRLNKPLGTIVGRTEFDGSLPGFFGDTQFGDNVIKENNEKIELFERKHNLKKSIRDIFEDYDSLGQLAPDEQLMSNYWKAKTEYFSHPRIGIIPPPTSPYEIIIPFFEKTNPARKYIDAIHSQIDFSNSQLHKQDTIENDDIEEILEAILRDDLENTIARLGYDSFGM